MTRYGVVVADPPWRYANAAVRGSAEDQYRKDVKTQRSTMSLIEICDLPVAQLVAADSVLFLWTTWPFLYESFAVMKAWGFEYVTGFPWLKIETMPRMDLFGELSIRPAYGVGWWIRGCSEPILICRRGDARPPRGSLVGLLSEQLQHSRKPENIYHIAETLPGPYLELFARRPRQGWSVWGNEVEGSIDLFGRVATPTDTSTGSPGQPGSVVADGPGDLGGGLDRDSSNERRG